MNFDKRFRSITNHEVLIDKALMGWKEYELELLEIK
jgi:carbamoylphosphate synthase large subunit